MRASSGTRIVSRTSKVRCRSPSWPSPSPFVRSVRLQADPQAYARRNGRPLLFQLNSHSLLSSARLTGFDNVTRDRLVVAPSTATRLDFTTRVSSICECIRVTGSLAEQWNHANAVLRVRLSASEPEPSTPQGYYRHAATALSALKEPERPRPGNIRSQGMTLVHSPNGAQKIPRHKDLRAAQVYF